MWAVFTVIGYFLLALLIPAVWSLAGVWRRTRGTRAVTCPELAGPAAIEFDGWYAVRMHALGEAELRVLACSHWPERSGCGRECLASACTGHP